MEKGEIKNILVKLSCDYMRFTHTCFSIVFKDSESIQKFTASELYVFYRIMDAFEYIPYLIEHIDIEGFSLDSACYKIIKGQLQYFIRLYEDGEFKKKEIREESNAVKYWLSYLESSVPDIKKLNEKISCLGEKK